MRDLREAIDGFLKARIVAMHEQKHVAMPCLGETPVKMRHGLSLLNPLDAYGGEFARGIGRHFGGPLHLAWYPPARYGDRNGDIGEVHLGGPFAAKDNPGLGPHIRAGSGHKQINAGSALSLHAHRQQDTFRSAGATARKQAKCSRCRKSANPMSLHE
jgi:hypothetical protein